MGGRVDHTSASNKAFAIWPMIHQGSVWPFFSWNLGPSTKNPTPSIFLPGFLAKKSGTVERKRKSMWTMPTAGSKTLGIQNVGESLGILWPKVKNLLWEKKSQIPRKKIHVASTTIIKRHLSHDSPNVFPDFGTIWPCKAFAFWQHVSQNAKPHRSRSISRDQNEGSEDLRCCSREKP